MEGWINFVILGIFVGSLVIVITLIKIAKPRIPPWPPINRILDEHGRFKITDEELARELMIPKDGKDGKECVPIGIGKLLNFGPCFLFIIMHMLNRR